MNVIFVHIFWQLILFIAKICISLRPEFESKDEYKY